MEFYKYMKKHELLLYEYLVLTFFWNSEKNNSIWTSQELENFVNSIIDYAKNKYNVESSLAKDYILSIMNKYKMIKEEQIIVYRTDDEIFSRIPFDNIDKIRKKFYKERAKYRSNESPNKGNKHEKNE